MSATKVKSTNRKLIYSRYRPFHVFKPVDDDKIRSCAFTHDGQCLLLGSGSAEVCIVIKYNDTLIKQKKVHETFVYSLVPHKSGELLLTSGVNPSNNLESALWYSKDDFENLFKLSHCHDAEFTNAQDKVLGSSGATAKLYDLNSGQVIQEFKPSISKLCKDNKAALDPYDKLLITCGVMFDVQSGKQVYKFDKMNPEINDVFHTNRLELIRSSEIFDLRTFHLLQTVESLKFCDVKFNNYGDVIFGFHLSAYYRRDIEVLDASDYFSIASINMRDTVGSVAINPMDTQIAVTEDSGVVRLFDIGMFRHEEEVDDKDDDDGENKNLIVTEHIYLWLSYIIFIMGTCLISIEFLFYYNFDQKI